MEPAVFRNSSAQATQEVLARITKCWPSEKWSDVPVLVGVSGGSDSVALALALALLQKGTGRLILTHFDHGLRAASRQEEPDLVAGLAKTLAAEFIGGRTAQAPAPSPSEEDLRDQRYAFFLDTLKNTGARYLALAHTFDDQVETLLHRTLRGTGLRGLRGMQVFRSFGDDWVIARPLLAVSRQLLRGMLREHQQNYCEDPTNQDLRWTRNWIRHDLLPMMQSRFPGAAQAVVRLGSQADEAATALRIWAAELSAGAVRFGSNEVTIVCTSFADRPLIVVQELLHLIWEQRGWPLNDMTHAHWQAVALAVRDCQSARLNLPGGIQFSCTSAQALLSQATHPH